MFCLFDFFLVFLVFVYFASVLGVFYSAVFVVFSTLLPLFLFSFNFISCYFVQLNCFGYLKCFAARVYFVIYFVVFVLYLN